MLSSTIMPVMARKAGAVGLAISGVVLSMAVFEAEAAGKGDWVVVSAEGAVRIEGQADDAAVGPGTAIETGEDGKVVLTRPGDSVTVFSNSRIAVPMVANGGKTGFVQTLGRLLFRMESRESRDFEVTTPYLAAAIKGTTFTVEVSGDDSVVEVSEGSVLVTAIGSGQSAYVGPGGRASVDRDSAGYVKLSAAGGDKNRIENEPEAAKAESGTESGTETGTEPEADTSAESDSSTSSGTTSVSSANGKKSDKKDSPSDDNSGKGNDPGNNGKPPGQK